MPTIDLSKFILLPELKLTAKSNPRPSFCFYFCTKESKGEVCPKCASFCTSIYDHRTVKVKDEPIRGKGAYLVIKKRRFYCKGCKKPFTEPVNGIMPRRKTTQRYRRSVLWAAENFSDLKKVRKAYRCSNDFIYKAVYEQLELRRKRHNNYPWPSRIGIDEHSFKRSKGYGRTEFVTMIVDHDNKKLREVVQGKTGVELTCALSEIKGRENVKLASIDMADPYKKFVKDFFPNAKLVADKFHVLRLLTPHINRKRKEITGDKRTNPIRKLLLRNRKKLKYYERGALDKWLALHPELREIYECKEALSRFYRIKGYDRAKRRFQKLLDTMALSKLKEIKTLRKTLMKWREEILNYFIYGLTNARTEGFNNVAKVIKKQSYGFKSFKNYRLRLLSGCS